MKRALILTLALTLAAVGAYAQHGPDHGERPHGFGGPVIIGSDGTAYVTKASSTAGSVNIVAIRSTGSASGFVVGMTLPP